MNLTVYSSLAVWSYSTPGVSCCSNWPDGGGWWRGWGGGVCYHSKMLSLSDSTSLHSQPSPFYTSTQYPLDSWQLSRPGYTCPELDGIWCGTISSSGHSEKEAASSQQTGVYVRCHGPSPRLPLSNRLLQGAYQQLWGNHVIVSTWVFLALSRCISQFSDIVESHLSELCLSKAKLLSYLTSFDPN